MLYCLNKMLGLKESLPLTVVQMECVLEEEGLLVKVVDLY